MKENSKKTNEINASRASKFISNIKNSITDYLKLNLFKIKNIENTNLNLALLHFAYKNINDTIFRLKILTRIFKFENEITSYLAAKCYLYKENHEQASEEFKKLQSYTNGKLVADHYLKLIEQSNILPSKLNNAAIIFDYQLVASYYENVKNAENYQVIYEALTSLTKQGFLNKELSILDLGCGTGMLSDELQSFNVKTKKLVGIDISTNMLKFAELKNQYNELLNDDYYSWLETQTEQYDLICFFNSIEEANFSNLVQKSYNLLTNGGILVFNTYKSKTEDVELDIANYRFLFSQQYLEDLLKKANLNFHLSGIKVDNKNQGFLVIVTKN